MPLPFISIISSDRMLNNLKKEYGSTMPNCQPLYGSDFDGTLTDELWKYGKYAFNISSLTWTNYFQCIYRNVNKLPSILDFINKKMLEINTAF